MPLPIKLVEFTIPRIPMSYTMSFKINYALRQTYLSKEARQFKDLVKVYMPSNKLQLQETDRLIMHNKYHFDWYFENGKIKKKDVQNLDRLLIDSIFGGLNLDDRNLFCVINEKVQDKEHEKTVVILYLANEEPDYMNTAEGL